MKSILFQFVVAVTLFFFVTIQAEPDPRYVCSFCLIVLGLVEESAFQIHLESALVAKCPTDGPSAKACPQAVKQLIFAMESKAVPEDLCQKSTMCTQDCPLFTQWPVDPLPDSPPAWPIEVSKSFNGLSLGTLKESKVSLVKESEDAAAPWSELKAVFASYMDNQLPEEWGMWGHVSVGIKNLITEAYRPKNEDAIALALKSYPDDCGYNISCHIQHIVDHKPLIDDDGDYYSMSQARSLRGNDWRGVDCDDKRADVYPGRRVSTYENDVDHNCNGITGGNATGSYEDIFCANSQPRGIVILGDSATAHFHIPPQWLTAKGWNMDQLLPDALNELDQPHCSWGTGHRLPEECPYQYAVPGVSGVVSLYTQLRERNRCNHNDYQNIGVNGARITSSMQLVEALARDNKNDNPLLVWLALIGNDICNGHPNFDSMTDPDEFYTKAMETLNALDEVVPSNSYVTALALFDGELLYQTMHSHVHPVGTTYEAVYDFMNCLEENPCWGWLNTNATVRRISTMKSNALNRVYQNISETQTFKNFQFIFFNPKWSDIFDDYLVTGRPLTDLIEPTDGFHPSQTGNAMFAQYFWKFLETEHPDAIGPINPYNAEIDALFFNQVATKPANNKRNLRV